MSGGGNYLRPIEAARDKARASRLEREVERLRNPLTSDSQASGASLMGIFSRVLDRFASRFDLVDQADDPARMIRTIIHEMEQTLVDVRASAARTIADRKEMYRHVVKLEALQNDWAEKAQLALSKDREDLARAALIEKRKSADLAEQLKDEVAVLDQGLRAYEQDIEKLQSRLREARSRQSQIATRLESAENRIKLRRLMTSERVDEALARFEQLERQVDHAEGRADALQLSGPVRGPNLADEIAALGGPDSIDAELEELKRARGNGSASRQED